MAGRPVRLVACPRRGRDGPPDLGGSAQLVRGTLLPEVAHAPHLWPELLRVGADAALAKFEGEVHLKIATLLRDLPIGADAAENDINLDSYFVRTSTYWNVISDQADVILGAKGSGKSSIARHLCSAESAEVELSHTDIIPAFNLEGVIAFRRLGTDFYHLNETSLRVVWLAYMVSLAGNHIVKNYPTLAEATILRDALGDADLLDKDNRQVRIWDKILQLARHIIPKRVQAQVSVDPTGVPSVGASVVFGDQQRSLDKFDLTQCDWYNLVEVARNALSEVNRVCWIIFDRLDEAFSENRVLEKSALRALLSRAAVLRDHW